MGYRENVGIQTKLTKICIASGTRGQSINVLEKIIIELKPNSPELRNEIDEKESKVNGTDAKIVFKNGSVIKVVTASDSARGNRANILLIDEYRLVIGVVDKSRLGFGRLFHKPPLAVIDGYFVSRFRV